MERAITEISQNGEVQYLLDQLDTDQNGKIHIEEVKYLHKDFFQSNPVTKSWSDCQRAAVENALFRAGLIEEQTIILKKPKPLRLNSPDQWLSVGVETKYINNHQNSFYPPHGDTFKNSLTIFLKVDLLKLVDTDKDEDQKTGTKDLKIVPTEICLEIIPPEDNFNLSEFIRLSQENPDLQFLAIQKANRIPSDIFKYISSEEGQLLALEKIDSRAMEDSPFTPWEDFSLKELKKKGASDRVIAKAEAKMEEVLKIFSDKNKEGTFLYLPEEEQKRECFLKIFQGYPQVQLMAIKQFEERIPFGYLKFLSSEEVQLAALEKMNLGEVFEDSYDFSLDYPLGRFMMDIKSDTVIAKIEEIMAEAWLMREQANL